MTDPIDLLLDLAPTEPTPHEIVECDDCKSLWVWPNPDNECPYCQLNGYKDDWEHEHKRRLRETNDLQHQTATLQSTVTQLQRELRAATTEKNSYRNAAMEALEELTGVKKAMIEPSTVPSTLFIDEYDKVPVDYNWDSTPSRSRAK